MPKRRSLESAGISDAQYLQIMERVAEQNYKDWGLPSSDAALVQALNDNTYNYRGYYNKYPNGKGNAVDHWTDEFKTVYHPTFSNESIYSGKKSQYNPNGLKGGHWRGETFIPANWQRNKFRKGGSTNGNDSDNSGIFGNESLDTFTSFLPILGTAQDAYAFYKDPSWSNAGWLAASLASDVFTGGMAGRAIKALRMANKAHDAAQVANRTARRIWEAGKAANTAQSGSVRGADMLRMINSVKSAGATRQAAIRRANDALFDAAVKVGIDQGINGFLNAAQLDMLPDIRSQRKDGGSIYIAPSKRGTFTAAANKRGLGVQEFAHRVLANRGEYSPSMVKKANFARNASKWNH